MKTCKKKAFNSFFEANKRILEIAKIDQENKKPIRVYLCLKCDKFHLTSIDKKQRTKVEIKVQKNKEAKRVLEAEFWAKRNKWDIEINN